LKNRLVRQTVALAAIAFVVWVGPGRGAGAPDAIDLLLQRGQVPADMRNRHGYSDFTDPLGRFLDLLAAGAFVEARAIQPNACAAWVANRQDSAFSGKFWIWDTEIDLDTLCPRN
jgi:hypothetical protein